MFLGSFPVAIWNFSPLTVSVSPFTEVGVAGALNLEKMEGLRGAGTVKDKLINPIVGFFSKKLGGWQLKQNKN